ncbi:FxLD family lanthipeptide [Sinosporangium album]|uniref:FxLD family lanthipeptide n=1 Tax=Sinosporangium album TaxID=504805 RepID=UPI001C40AE7C|nr:FxLD family lanthipeptide [Sinosporangium album]
MATAQRQAGIGALEEEFILDVRVVEAAQPVAGLLRSTSDNCGSTCEGTAAPRPWVTRSETSTPPVRRLPRGPQPGASWRGGSGLRRSW